MEPAPHTPPADGDATATVLRAGGQGELALGRDFAIGVSPRLFRLCPRALALEHPLLLDAQQRMYVSFGPTRTLSNADFSGLIFNQTSITLLRLGLTYSRTQLDGSLLQLGSYMSSNFKTLSIEDFAASEVEGNQRFRWEADAQYLLQLTRSFQMYMRLNGAWSPDPLVDTEKYSLGGPGSVRGYPSSEVRGDQGYFGSMALQGSPNDWVTTHRIHHAFTETDGDPHSPRNGTYWAHIGWILFKVNPEVKVRFQMTGSLPAPEWHCLVLRRLVFGTSR